MLFNYSQRQIDVSDFDSQTVHKYQGRKKDNIKYNNFEITERKIYSIFDYLYKQYTVERIAYLQKHNKVSEYDSENLMYSLIEDIIIEKNYTSLDVVCNFPLRMHIKNWNLLNDEQYKFVMNPATHLDFVIYN